MAHVCLSVCPAQISIWTNPNWICDHAPKILARVVVPKAIAFATASGYAGSVEDCWVPRAAQGPFLRNSPNCIFGPWKVYLYTEKISRHYNRSKLHIWIPKGINLHQKIVWHYSRSTIPDTTKSDRKAITLRCPRGNRRGVSPSRGLGLSPNGVLGGKTVARFI